MEDFRRDIDAQHASQELIEATLKQIQREAELEKTAGFGNKEQMVHSSRVFGKRETKRMPVGFGIIIVCVMIAVMTTICQTGIIYNEMGISVERGNRMQKGFTEITLKEYEQYLNKNLSECCLL